MRFLSTLPDITLGSGTLPGTTGEALDYAMREAMSPEAQEFVGGATVWGLLVFIALVLLIIYLAKNI